MFVVLYIRDPSGFFGKSSDKIENLIAVASLAYLVIQMYNAIQTVGRNQVVQGENAEINLKKGKQGVIKKFLLNTILPVAIILISLFVEQWYNG